MTLAPDIPNGMTPVVHHRLADTHLPPGSVVAIGSFDGVHLGHQAVIGTAIELTRSLGKNGEVAVLTFDPHPAKVLAPDLAPDLICTTERRVAWLGEAGANHVILQPFDRALAALPAEVFIRDLLLERPGVAGVVVGFDFTFGKGGQGTTSLLQQEASRHGVAVRVLDPFHLDGILVSSTKIREFVLSGRVYGASKLLGRPFELSGNIVRGAGRGRTLGFPTANVAVVQELQPAHGVYAARARVGDELIDAAVSIGIVPTFGHDNAITVEAYLLDFSGDLYGQELRLEFVRRLRPEKRFKGPDELIAQINLDVMLVRDILLTL